MDKNRIIMIGSGCIDEYYELSHVPVMGEKTTCTPLKSRVGGMIGNAASVAAAYGMDTYLMDTVNHSTDSQRVQDDFRRRNIRLDLIRYDDTLPDVKCIIFLKDGERMIYVIPTCKQQLIMDSDQEGIIKEAGYIYSTAAELRCFAEPVRTVDRMKRLGTKLVLDVEYVERAKAREEWELYSRADLLFINSEGAGQMAERFSKDYIKLLLEAGSLVVRTMGGGGSRIYESNGSETEILACRVPPVDTTGAGDTFNTSFIYGLSRGWEARKAGDFASAAAARSIQYMGPRSGAVGEEQVREFIRAYKEEAL